MLSFKQTLCDCSIIFLYSNKSKQVDKVQHSQEEIQGGVEAL